MFRWPCRPVYRAPAKTSLSAALAVLTSHCWRHFTESSVSIMTSHPSRRSPRWNQHWIAPSPLIQTTRGPHSPRSRPVPPFQPVPHTRRCSHPLWITVRWSLPSIQRRTMSELLSRRRRGLLRLHRTRSPHLRGSRFAVHRLRLPTQPRHLHHRHTQPDPAHTSRCWHGKRGDHERLIPTVRPSSTTGRTADQTSNNIARTTANTQACYPVIIIPLDVTNLTSVASV